MVLMMEARTCAPTCCAAEAVVIGPTMTHRSAMRVEEDIHRQRAPWEV